MFGRLDHGAFRLAQAAVLLAIGVTVGYMNSDKLKRVLEGSCSRPRDRRCQASCVASLPGHSDFRTGQFLASAIPPELAVAMATPAPCRSSHRTKPWANHAR